MYRNTAAIAILLVTASAAATASGQTASIAHRHPATRTPKRSANDPRNLKPPAGNPTLEKHSLTAVKIQPPRAFRVHDLITIIVREQRKFESDAELQTKKKFDIKSQLDALFKPVEGTLGAATFVHGKPDVDFKLKNNLKYESDKDREDRFTTRITSEVIDVKPNGNLVVQAKAETRFDNELAFVTLTGVVRADDVTPDNTVLSTQLADKVIDVQNHGAVRDGSRRGWITRLLDVLRPF